MAARRRADFRDLAPVGAVAADRPECGLADESTRVRREHEACAVGRPRGLRSKVDELLWRAAGRGHDPDAAALHRMKRDPLAVRRPGGLHVLPAIACQRYLSAA